MGKIIKFPDKGVETPERAEEYNRSLPPATQDQADYRREQFRVIEGEKDD